MKIAFVFGTRPEVIKFTPVIREVVKRNIDFYIIHTNQHTNDSMSGDFFKEFNLPKIKYQITDNFELSRCYQKIKKILRGEKPTFVFVQGDTDSALTGCLAGVDCHLPVAHRESGVRSFDHRMHEEKNRIMIDKLSYIHFAPTKIAMKNLENEEVGNKYLVGNTLVDLISSIKLTNRKRKGIFFTFHRKENIESPEVWHNVLTNLEEFAGRKGEPIIFPIHPSARNKLIEFEQLHKVLSMVKESKLLNYRETVETIKGSSIVITDSGGIQEESAIIGTPCYVIRNTTDRPELIEVGASKLLHPLAVWPHRPRFPIWKHPYGKNVAKKIINILQEESCRF